MDVGTDPVWRLHGQAKLHWHHWADDEWTVFDGGSGQTHLLSALTAFAVMSLEAAPATVVQIAAECLQELPAPVDVDIESVLRETFGRLSAAYLIEPAPR